MSIHRGRDFAVRRAGPDDVEEMAAAHVDSIRSLGARCYEPAIVTDWGARVSGSLYLHAMARGEVFFVAVGELEGRPRVLGFSSWGTDGREHWTAVYVRGAAARQGVGSALFRAAEAAAADAGATSLDIDASLAAVEFHKKMGFAEVGRGTHRLASGHEMACVFMRKVLAAPGTRRAPSDTE